MKSNPYFYQWYYYTQSQRRGFIALVIVVLTIHLSLCLMAYYRPQVQYQDTLTSEEQQELQKEVDRLRLQAANKKDTIYPFNPNYITDFKGYVLELSVEEIDRLFAFRKKQQYINSKEDFQRVTAVSDEWMKKYSSYFVFRSPSGTQGHHTTKQYLQVKKEARPTSLILKDINQATQQSLQEIYGIGPVLAKRIIEDRDRWGGYVHQDQFKWVYGLSEQVVEKLVEQYSVLTPPKINQVDLNQAGVNELKNIPYLNYYLAREIVKYRSLHGDFVNKEQLKEIEKIPLDRIHIISLYLEIRN
ncbi:helix-hairpin-helix domain-containing protein [Myroides sp. WP-1]|uniref:ComEA family DNA-binding protein n=1 Tax=Myroides sp. WP-1 TaxID=2759944 RepID=UPI0015FB89FC|nr:helix-hairpin-helix domain-containing protein [Myroides sp. WP-1]MBB1138645.1 helix-hairpin-helix domain-containing protein [Myroides sp. WP-1]